MSTVMKLERGKANLGNNFCVVSDIFLDFSAAGKELEGLEDAMAQCVYALLNEFDVRKFIFGVSNSKVSRVP